MGQRTGGLRKNVRRRAASVPCSYHSVSAKLIPSPKLIPWENPRWYVLANVTTNSPAAWSVRVMGILRSNRCSGDTTVVFSASVSSTFCLTSSSDAPSSRIFAHILEYTCTHMLVDLVVLDVKVA